MRLSYEKALAHLEALRVYTKASRPTEIERLLELLGAPQQALRCIHIAGTNGKGSVAAMLESIYRQAGYRVGLYTSPHLVDWTERIQINRIAIEKADFAQACEAVFACAYRVQSKHWGIYFTAFELLTACACKYFAEQKVDIAIFETGIGGRLDPTNVLGKVAAVITSIGADHEALLGTGLARIAAEKSGIIAPHVPVVMGVLPAEAQRVVRSYAWAKHAVLTDVQEAFGEDIIHYPQTSLEGDHQRRNAACAVLTVNTLQRQFPVSDKAIQAGLVSTQWAGRWQRCELSNLKTIILEAAHNAEAAICLEEMICAEIRKRGKRPHLWVGFLDQTRAHAILAIVVKYAQSISCIDLRDPGAFSAERCLDLLGTLNYTGPICLSYVDELLHENKSCRVGLAGDWMLATGSIRLLGQILRMLRN